MAFVEVTKKDNIAIVTMNRPEALNALNKAVFADFEAALDQVEFDDDVYVIIITGSGRSFIAGRRHRRNGSHERGRRPGFQ